MRLNGGLILVVDVRMIGCRRSTDKAGELGGYRDPLDLEVFSEREETIQLC